MPEPTVESRSKNLWPPLLLALVTLVVFSPVLRHDFIEPWDDGGSILWNDDYNPPHLANLRHYWALPPQKTFYVPVTYSIWGLLAFVARTPGVNGAWARFNPLPYHAVNLLAHAVSALLVYAILWRLVRVRWAAWIGAAIFALHPIQVEAVAWAATMYTPLSTVFSLIAVFQFMAFTDAIQESRERIAWTHYTVASIAFGLALLTKPSVVTVPLVVGAIEVMLRRRRLWKVLPPLVPWVAAGAAIALLTQQTFPPGSVYVPDPLRRFVVAGDAVWFYLYKLLIPVHLLPDYGRTPRVAIDSRFAPILDWVPVALFVLCFAARRRAAWVGGAAAVFALALLPTLGLAPFDYQRFSTVADRYVYLAMLGPATAVAYLIAMIRPRPVHAALIAIPILALLAILTVAQLSRWQNAWTLFAYELEERPASLTARSAFYYLLEPPGYDPYVGHVRGPEPCPLPPERLVRIGDILRGQQLNAQADWAYQRVMRQPAHNPAAPRSAR